MNRLQLIKNNYFGKGEVEAFFGLFGDVFSKIGVIVGVLYFAEGFPIDIVMGKILPGIAVGSILGCILYFKESVRLGKKEGRSDVTALPFGISSTQVFTWLFLIMVPIYRQTGNATTAWQVALAACFIGGFIEMLGGYVSKFFVKYIPNSALVGSMAAGALVWLAFNGFITVFQAPMISVIPLFLILLTYKIKKPFLKGVPNTLLILIVGSILAWATGHSNMESLRESLGSFAFYPPTLTITDVFVGMKKIVPYLSIIIPLEISNFIATLQSVQSAAMTGDEYPVKRTLIIDGITTVVSSFTGSPFPTSVYYGHMGWKKIGAKSGYSLLMACAYITCFLGLPLVILEIIPYEVIIILLVFVGLTVTTEVVDGLEKEYSGVIFISLFPVLAQYMHNLINDVLAVAGTSVHEIGIEVFSRANVMVSSIEILSYGAFTSSLLYATWIAYIYGRKFARAGGTALVLSALSAIGFIHHVEIAWLPRTGVILGLVYLVIAIICFGIEKKEKEVLS